MQHTSPTRNGEWMPKIETPDLEWPPYIENPRCPSLFKMVGGYVLHPGDAGFNIENFDDSHVWPLLNATEYEHAYKLYFAGKDHEVYVNTVDDATIGPVVICCEKHNPSNVKISLKVLIQTKKGAERAQLATTAVAEMGMMKALLNFKPDFTKLKLKQVGRSIEKALLIYEEQIVRNVYKFGVLYCKEGQNQEDEMYNNEHGSEAFEEFLDFLGERIVLQGFTGYRGGLDVKENTTGTHSVYTKHLDGCEIMFHVSTLLKYYPMDPQQVERKRHLGNDVILIIFREGKNQPFDMSTIHSQFNHVFFVVTPERGRGKGPSYRVEIGAKDGVAHFGPPLPSNVIGNDLVSRSWFLSKLINAERAAFYAPSFVMKFRDTRKQQLTNIINNAKSDTPKKSPGSGIKRSLQSMKMKMSGSSLELPDNYFSAPHGFNHVAHMDNGTLTQLDSSALMDIFAPDVPFFKFDNNPLKPPPGPPQDTGNRFKPPPEPPRGVSFGNEEDEEFFDEDDDELPPISAPAGKTPKKGNTWGSNTKAGIARPTISADAFKPPSGAQPSSSPALTTSNPPSSGRNDRRPPIKRPAPTRPTPPAELPSRAPPPVPAGAGPGPAGAGRRPTVPPPSSHRTPGQPPSKPPNNNSSSNSNGHSGGPGSRNSGGRGGPPSSNGSAPGGGSHSPSHSNNSGGGSPAPTGNSPSGNNPNRPNHQRRLSRGAGRGGTGGTLKGTKKLPPPPTGNSYNEL